MIYMITFYSESCAIYTDRTLKERNIISNLIPVPRVVSSSCGYAVEYEGRELGIDEVVVLMNERGIEWDSVYKVLPSGRGEDATNSKSARSSGKAKDKGGVTYQKLVNS